MAVRIHHPTVRSTTFWLHEEGGVTPEGVRRFPKSRPLDLDADGNTIVVDGVWQRICEGAAAGRLINEFIVLNEVKDPPDQRVRVGVPLDHGELMPQVEQRIADAIRAIAPAVRSVSITPSNKVRNDVVRIAEQARRS